MEKDRLRSVDIGVLQVGQRRRGGLRAKRRLESLARPSRQACRRQPAPVPDGNQIGANALLPGRRISTGPRSSFAELPSFEALFACNSGRSRDSCAKWDHAGKEHRVWQKLRGQVQHELSTGIDLTRWVGSIGLAVAVGIVYFVAARLSLALLTKPEGVAVFWPAAGVSAGVLIALGSRARWPVVVGTMAATIAATLWRPESLERRSLCLMQCRGSCALGVAH